MGDLTPTQPVCPSDGVVMRDGADGWVCPECGYRVPWEAVETPAEFDGPSIRGF